MLRASIIMETTFKKYQQNLKVKNNNVYSYNTLVAKISGDLIKKVSWNVNGKTTSPTTNKHINYVAEELDLIKDWTI
jgi:hypothetical protein